MELRQEIRQRLRTARSWPGLIEELEREVEQIESKEMPLPSYLWIHRGAKLSVEEIKTLCDWTNQERRKLSAEN